MKGPRGPAPRHFTAEEDRQLIAWRKQRISVIAIASAIGCSAPTVYRRIHELGLVMQRAPKEGRKMKRGIPAYCARVRQQPARLDP
jgi:AraC-like DNA-binding protein